MPKQTKRYVRPNGVGVSPDKKGCTYASNNRRQFCNNWKNPDLRFFAHSKKIGKIAVNLAVFLKFQTCILGCTWQTLRPGLDIWARP